MGQTRDFIIIGGGHNGLVTAFYLARAGKKVLVLERRGTVGGAAITDEFRRRGVGLEVMDTGAACRTYNVLVYEERAVAAALILAPGAQAPG